MSATIESSGAVSAAPPPRALARAEGLQLLGEVSGSGHKAGAALVRRADGQMVQLGPLLYGLLEELDGERDETALAAAMSARLGRRLDPEQVAPIAERLAQQGLLAGSESDAPPRVNPLLALRFKILVTDPKVTRRITRPFEVLFRPWLLLPMLAGFAAVCWFVLIHHGVAAATAEAFGKPELLLLVLGLTIGSAALHEIGHAAACRFGGGEPGGMGAGIYVVWPAFYTDVTDAYRLPRRARLRTDCGGIYLNAVIAVATLGAWLLTNVDALLLLIAVQMLEIVKNLSPVFRSDGYHILADATGVPDLYAHMGPTLRRLLPWRRTEPSALTRGARVLVTAWVLIVVPVLLSMTLSAILLFPRLAATAWASGSDLLTDIGDQAGRGDVLAVAASVLRLVALALPVAGVTLLVVRLVRSVSTKAWGWSAGRAPRRALVLAGAAGVIALLAWAWWPSGQFRPVRATDDGTLAGAFRTVSSPTTAARPAPVAGAPRLAPGRHTAVALIPRGGPTKAHPALFVVNGGDEDDEPTIIASTKAPDASRAPTMDQPASASAAATPTATATATPAAKSGASPAPTTAATQLPFTLPDKPGPGDSQALAVNTKDGGIVYDVAYSLVTVADGEPVANENSAYALASCKACTTLAVSLQLVLVVGQTDRITPINIAEALNLKCPECITTAIAKQIVVSVTAKPSDELLRRLEEELRKLDAIDESDSPEDVLNQVNAVSDSIQKALDDSGITYPKDESPAPKADGTPARPTATPAPGASATPAPSATASPAPTATATATATTTASPSPTPTATASPAPTATASPTPAATTSATPAPTP